MASCQGGGGGGPSTTTPGGGGGGPSASSTLPQQQHANNGGPLTVHPSWNPGAMGSMQQHAHHGGGGSAAGSAGSATATTGPGVVVLGVRSLERALEDAQSSGLLNLSGRKMRDWPATGHDLTDTTQADLSRNRLSEVPPEVCLFSPLESLNLYHNVIKVIPEAIINLQMLTYLNVSRNQLGALPRHLFSLPLRVLVVSNNKLQSIPEDIGRVRQLMELDVSCNEIRVLPPQVGRLHALRELNVRKNHLHMLPEELSELPLIRLDFSCNKITEIPATYRRMKELQHIVLDNNPMQSPPAQICLKGKVHIFKYLHMQACRADKKPDSLDLPSSLGKRCCLPQPLTDSMEDFYPSRNHGPDSGIGSDNGDNKRLSTTEPSDDDTISLHSQVSETARADALSLLSKMDPCKDQDLYDFIDPNPEDDCVLLSEDGGPQGVHVSCIKDLEKVLNMAHQNRDKEEESGSDKEAPGEEEDEELKEVLDLRKIAVQLLQQEQQNRRRSLICRAESLIHRRRVTGRAHRFLSHSGGSSNKQRSTTQTARSASLDEGTSGGPAMIGQPASSCSFDGGLRSEPPCDSEPRWPDLPPVLNQNEERRRTKYLRKDYLKYKCQSARKNSCGNDECEDGVMRNSEFSSTLTVFGLKPRSAFCRATRQQENSEPGFTMRRKMEHLREEMEQIALLRQNIECRLKVLLPDDVGAALMDGVVLCHLANHVCPRSVASIHVPSPAVPKLSMAKCRRNVENFLDACKKLGVPQDQLCLPHHILEQRGLVKVGVTVQALLDRPPCRPSQLLAV